MSAEYSNFDPNLFLDASTTEAATKRPELPVQDYPATVEDITFRVSQGKKDPSKTYTFMDIKFKIEVPSHLVSKGIPEVVVITGGVGVDTVGSALDWSPGKNRQLARYREALDMNKPGVAFSPRAMIGRQIKVRIKHELYEGNIQERIDSVSKL